MTQPYENPDNKLVLVIGSTIAKSVLYICCTVVACMWVSSCQLEDAIIASCENSCHGYGSHMESVTTRECVCSPIQAIEPAQDMWVLPK